MEEIISIGTVLASLGLILLGLNDDLLKKKSQLMFVLSSNAILIGTNYFTDNQNDIKMILMLLTIFLFGGLGFMGQKNISLEKELTTFQLLLFSSTTIFFLTYEIFNFLYVFIIFMLRRHELLNSLHTVGIKGENIELLIGICLMIIQYVFVTKDFFNIHPFEKTIRKWNPQIENNNPKYKLENFSEKTIELLSFIVFVEDRDFFKRSQSYIPMNEFIKKIYNKISIFYENKTINQESHRMTQIWKKLKPFLRGYSTIEQQFVRQYAMHSYSYRYIFRRKVLIERIYTPLLMKAIINRKSRIFFRNRIKRRKAKKDLILPLKFSILMSYYENVLYSPKDVETLINTLVKQSALTKEDMEFKHHKYVNSYEKSCIENSIRKSLRSKYYV